VVIADKCFVIAEAGVNHNGSEELALQLIDVAADAGADAVKFQTFRADKLVNADAPKAEYQETQTGGGKQFEMLQKLELSESMHHSIVKRCVERDVEFMSTPFDADSANFLVELGMRRIKVPSGELTNKPFVEYLAAFDLPMIVSTGMATLSEVQEAVHWIETVRKDKNISGEIFEILSLLHCTSNYPAAFKDVNLLAMCTMREQLGLPVGYSDHTNGIAIATAAVALGASIVEKHFTLDRNLPGPDHQASLEPDELSAMIDAIRSVELSLGDGIKNPRESELPIRDVARRSLTLVDDLPAGHSFQESDLQMLRPGTGIPPKEMEAVIGRRLKHALRAGSTLKWDDIA